MNFYGKKSGRATLTNRAVHSIMYKFIPKHCTPRTSLISILFKFFL